MDPLPLVIDTDTGSDDAVALLLAVLSGLADVRAVTTVAGNVPVDLATRNALVTLDVAGASGTPVYAGADRPLVRPLRTAQRVHGRDGMGDVGLPEPRGGVAPGHAVDVLLGQPRGAPGELTLVTLGPLTNLAVALLRDRALLGRYRHVYCMAGAADAVGNISATAEFNVWADPEAAHIVLDAADPDHVTWIGWDVSRHDAVMGPDEQRRLAGLGTPAADFAHRINRTLDDWATGVTGLAGYDLPDAVAVAVALRPGLVTARERVSATVALSGPVGQLVVDRRPGRSPNVTLVRRADGPGFTRMLLGALGGRDPR